MTDATPTEMLTVQDIRKILKVSQMTVYREIHDGVLPAFQIGRSLRVDPRDFADYMRNASTRRGAA